METVMTIANNSILTHKNSKIINDEYMVVTHNISSDNILPLLGIPFPSR